MKGGKKFEYNKDFVKIEFDSDDNLSLNKPLKFPTITVIVRSVFVEHGKFYPQIYLGKCLYELQKCCNRIELMLQKELTLIKQVHQKNICFVIIVVLKMLVINFNYMFVMVVILYQ